MKDKWNNIHISSITLLSQTKRIKQKSTVTQGRIFFVLKNVATAVRRNAISHPSVARLRSNFANLSRSRDINGRSGNEISRLNFHDLHRHPRDMCRVARCRVCRVYEPASGENPLARWGARKIRHCAKRATYICIDNSMVMHHLRQTLIDHFLHNTSLESLDRSRLDISVCNAQSENISSFHLTFIWFEKVLEPPLKLF